jgi:aminopeptidase N
MIAPRMIIPRLPFLGRSRAAALLLLLLGWSLTQAATEPPPAGAPPRGALPDLVTPTAYRLDLIVDPAAPRFRGHAEIDASLSRPASSMFLHGSGLAVAHARLVAGRVTLAARYTQVDASGVARVDLPRAVPAGPITLIFDYSAAFRTGAEGLYHAEVAKRWYAWTQMEPVDARRMFPGFDQPGFKTPFTVTVTAPREARVFANAPETGETRAGALTVHRFAPTKPLPTYLVAIGVGPFDVLETTVPPNQARTAPLPFRVIATRGQLPRMRFALAEGPKLLGLLETYLQNPYPFEKLDFLASPIEAGAMENAGLIIFDDTLILLDDNAPLRQIRGFGEVSAHEMAHQWFGDLVTPTWWTDIWLNESFAEWMGKKSAQQWRPELGVGASELSEAFSAMDTDSLNRGRPIRQLIAETRQIASAFDSITYQKGAQVLSMYESYLGQDRFARGVRVYLGRYPHGNASADDFFRALGETAGDPAIVPSMRSFIDQTGVPLITIAAAPAGITLSQERYRPLGTDAAAPQTWIIPLCLARGATKTCALLDGASATEPTPGGTGPLMPNADGAGYYRFRLDAAGWDGLTSAAPRLPGREALALADSLWADFAAGPGSFERVIAGARALSQNEERLAVVELGSRLRDLADSVLTPADQAGYRRLMQSIYGARLAGIGLDLAPGAYAGEPIARQALRQTLLSFAALDGHDSALREKLAAAAAAYVGGDAQALDPAFRSVALQVAAQDRGAPFLRVLKDALVASSDPLFRADASYALGSGDTPALAGMALRLALSPDLQPLETFRVVSATAHHPATRDTAFQFSAANFKRVMETFPGFARPELISMFDGYCAVEDAARLEALMRPKLAELGGGELELAEGRDRIARCAALKQAKGAEITAALLH